MNYIGALKNFHYVRCKNFFRNLVERIFDHSKHKKQLIGVAFELKCVFLLFSDEKQTAEI